jgi:hypothetical protein
MAGFITPLSMTTLVMNRRMESKIVNSSKLGSALSYRRLSLLGHCVWLAAISRIVAVRKPWHRLSPVEGEAGTCRGLLFADWEWVVRLA